ncbi:unnamed protein product [Trichobilharzia regenti]|nr:unnamed protein product [Trichobilharzia regenti]
MSTLECADCAFKSTTFDPFWDLSLPIPKVSLNLALFLSPTLSFSLVEKPQIINY